MKTTVLNIDTCWWTKKPSGMTFNHALEATLAVATNIALWCQMDILSLSHVPVNNSLCATTVVYLNNGVSPQSVCQMMEPHCNTNPRWYWKLQSIEEWQNVLLCQVTLRGDNEEWEA